MNMVYDEEGSGIPVLLLHGIGGNANVWRGCATSLQRHFRTICPDLPGSGRSAHDAAFTTSSLVDHVHALLDQLQIEQAHMVGHSYGCFILQQYAVRNPRRVRSLSLLGPLHSASEQGRKMLAERAKKARSEGLVAIANTTVQVGTSARTKSARPEVAAFVRELVMGQDPEGYAATCEAAANVGAATFEALQCPTLVLTGDEDATSPPAAAKEVADRARAEQFHVIGSCGHWHPVEAVHDVTERLLNFLITH